MTLLFFVSDIHGSERCFRKFINAAKFYSADVLVLGGDIAGKAVVPIIRFDNGVFRFGFEGKEYVLSSETELKDIMKKMEDSGYYYHICEKSEYERLKSKRELVDQLFKELVCERLHRWIKLAEERLKGTGVRCYISPGNDDFLEIDDILNSSNYVINPEEKVVNIDEIHEMITLGYSNKTPWNSERELSEEALEEKIENLAKALSDVSKSIFNLHVPPIDTPLDQAIKLDENFKPVISGGEAQTVSAGSVAVRRCIEKYQPLLGLHGHIHESRGATKIGRTICFNPGSEYESGILRGLLCQIENGSVKSYVFTTG